MTGDGGVAAGGDSTAAAGAPSDIISTPIDLPAKPRGFLFAVQTAHLAETIRFDYSSAFAEFEVGRGRWDGCTRHQLAECWYYDCPSGSYPLRDPNLPRQTAGTVSVSSPLPDTGELLLDGDPGITYLVYSDKPLWPFEGGPTISFSATGDVAPAFSLDLRAPPAVFLSTVNGQAKPPISIQRSQGIQLTWTSSGAGTAFFSIMAYKWGRSAAECEFDALANAGELSARLLSALEPGASYYLSFEGVSRARRSVDGWELEATAISDSTGTLPVVTLALE